jgi:hypothetical protein
MAITVAYGLTIATLVTLVILPLLISVLNDVRRVFGWAWNASAPTAESVEPAVKEMPYEDLEEHHN